MCQSRCLGIISFVILNLLNIEVFSQSVTDISGLQIWLRGDTGVVFSGTQVLQWLDISGNNNHFIPVSSSTRPELVTSSSLNNKPYILFDGSKRIQSTNNISLSNATLVVIAENNTGDPLFGRTIDHSYNSGFWIGRGSGSNVGGGFFEGTAPYGNFMPIALDQPYAITMIRSGSETTSLRGSEFFTIPTRVTSGLPTASNKVMLGASINGGDSGNKDIYEVLIWNRELTSYELSVLQDYLRNRYSNAVALGSDIMVQNSLCPITLVPTSGFSSYMWSTGETTSTISVSQSGQYWVRATDILGFYSYDTIQVSFPEISYPTNTAICVNQSSNWNAGLGSSYSYLWSTGATSESVSISNPGTYSVTVTDAAGCTQTSQSLTYFIDTYEYEAFLGNDTSLCTGNPLALQIGAAETVSYSWQGGVPSVVATYPVGLTGNYWLQSTNIHGCIARDTIFVTIAGTAPNAEFTVQNHCLNAFSPIVDQSTGVGSDFVAQWQWDMGNGAVLSGQNINYTYPLPGIYPVELYVQSVGGCGAYHYDTIEVFVNPAAQFSFVGHCQNQEVQFSNASMPGGASLSAYSWDFGMPWTGSYNTSNIPIPNRIFEQVGSYDVKLVVTDLNGCKDSLIQTVQIDPSPQPNFVFQSTCQGTPIQFLNSSVTQPSSQYLWTFGDNTSSILVNPQHTYADYGINEVTLQVTNLYQCAAMSIQNVEVYALPIASMQLGAACVDSYLTLENSTSVPMGAVDSTMWIINQTDTLYGVQSAWMVTALGQQQAELYTWSAQGCAAQTSQFFDVTEQFNASFSTGTGVVAVGQPFQFENTSNPGSIALWTFGDGAVSTEFSPEHTYSAAWEDETIDVMLIALNSSGCLDSSIQQVYIRQPRLDMEVTQLFLQQNGDWYTMGVRLKNVGTVDLATADFVVETNKGLLFNETWNGSLKPTEDSIYVFSAMPTSIFTDQDNIESYICLAGRAYDIYANAETALDNNTVCQNIEGTSIFLLPVFPNPVSSDFTVRIYVSQEAEVFLSLDDERGRTVRSLETGALLQPGYYDYPISSLSLSDGFYYLNLRAGDQKQAMKVSIIR